MLCAARICARWGSQVWTDPGSNVTEQGNLYLSSIYSNSAHLSCVYMLLALTNWTNRARYCVHSTWMCRNLVYWYFHVSCWVVSEKTGERWSGCGLLISGFSSPRVSFRKSSHVSLMLFEATCWTTTVQKRKRSMQMLICAYWHRQKTLFSFSYSTLCIISLKEKKAFL